MTTLSTTPAQAAKQVLVIRKDLNMRKGKLAAQASHASTGSVLPREKAQVDDLGDCVRVSWVLTRDQFEWFMDLSTKIVVSVNSEIELMEIHRKAQAAGLPCVLIQDRGFTEFGGVPTYTAVGVGPAPQPEVDAITGHLPLL